MHRSETHEEVNKVEGIKRNATQAGHEEHGRQKQPREIISGPSDEKLEPFNPDHEESNMTMDVVTKITDSTCWEEVLVQPASKERICITCDEAAVESFEKRCIAETASKQEQNGMYYAFKVRWQDGKERTCYSHA